MRHALALTALLACGFASCQGDGDKKPPNASSPANIVILHTLANVVSTATCGGVQWTASFELTNPPSADGWIVQEVDWSEDVVNCDDTPYGSASGQYWEAWWVPKDHTYPATRQVYGVDFDDVLAHPRRPDTRGTYTMSGLTKFYEGLELPADFVFANPDTAAQLARSTTSKPSFWSSDAATIRSFTIIWDCCVRPPSHTLTTDPPTPEREVSSRFPFVPGPLIGQESKHAAEVADLVDKIPPFSGAPYTREDGAKLRELGDALLHYSALEIEHGLEIYLGRHRDERNLTAIYSRPYLAIRVIFDVPRTVPESSVAQRFDAFWPRPPVREGAYDLLWPLAPDEKGNLTVAARPPEWSGPSMYLVRDEFSWFYGRFDLRKPK